MIDLQDVIRHIQAKFPPDSLAEIVLTKYWKTLRRVLDAGRDGLPTLIELHSALYRDLREVDMPFPKVRRTVRKEISFGGTGQILGYYETVWEEPSEAEREAQKRLIANEIANAMLSALADRRMARAGTATEPQPTGKPGPKGPRSKTIRRRGEIKALAAENVAEHEACMRLTLRKIELPSSRLQEIYKGDWRAWYRDDPRAFQKQWSKDLNSV